MVPPYNGLQASAAAVSDRRRVDAFPAITGFVAPPVTRPVAKRAAVHTVALALVASAIASSFVVSIEPAPYDLLMLGLMLLLPAAGLTVFGAAQLAYLLLWLAIVAAGFLAAGLASDPDIAAGHIAVTLYLAATSFVIAAFVAFRPRTHSDLIFKAYVAAAVAGSALALAGSFDLFDGAREIFTVHQRAAGAFKDPNVFAPFLIPPLLYLIHQATCRGAHGLVLAIAGVAIMALAILLSFSRGAWLNLAVALALYWPLAVVIARSDRERIRLTGLACLFGAIAGLVILAALQSDDVVRLLLNRAAFDQSYDHGPDGRFGGQLKAIAIILQHPFGFGALNFGGVIHPEHPHNVYLSQFLNGGWVGGTLYLALIGASVWVGLRATLARSEASPFALIALASLAGLLVEGLVVETDHWRSFYLTLGLLWGLAGPLPSRSAGLTRADIPPALIGRTFARHIAAAPRRGARIALAAPRIRMSAHAPRRQVRRRQPKRRARVVVH